MLDALALKLAAGLVDRMFGGGGRREEESSHDLRIRQIDEQLAAIRARRENRMLASPVAEAPVMEAPSPALVDFSTGTTGQGVTRKQIAVGCLPCARAHLATIAGSLKEAIRFALGEKEGILHPEVQSRLETAEEDITVIERHDWTPEKIAVSPPEEAAVIRDFLPDLRKLRQDIHAISSTDDLEACAMLAAQLSNRLRQEVLKLKGVGSETLNMVLDLANKVSTGEMTMDDAKAQLVRNVKGSLPTT